MLRNAWVGKNCRWRSAWFLRVLCVAVIAPAVLSGRAAGTTASPGYYQSARLAAGDLVAGDAFGRSVAIDEHTAIIGAPQDDDGEWSNSGSAYVYNYDPAAGAWVQSARLLASDPGNYHLFGTSVAIRGDIAFVAAPTHPPGGLIYMFERNQGGPEAWGEVRQILGDEVTWGDYFGISIDVSEDLLIAGAYAGGDYDGCAYVFARDQGGANAWGQVARLVPADNPAYNYFGYSVAISGETAVGGGPGNNGVIGAAYVFERQADQSWLEVAQLTPGDGAYQDFFGLAVDIDGDTLAAGSPGNGAGGAVYVYERNLAGPQAWGLRTKLLAGDGALGDGLGEDVQVTGDRVFAGATGHLESAGGVYVYAPAPDGSGVWEEIFKLVADEPAPGEGLGGALAADDRRLLAGALGAAPGGAAYVYTAYAPPAEINLTLAPNPLPEGTEAVLTGSFSDPDPAESHTLVAHWGDGATITLTLPQETYAFTLTHTYQDDQPGGTPADPYTLTVVITDTGGGAAWAQLPLVVENVIPVIQAGADATLHAGESLQRWGVIIDPGTDTWTGLVDYDDGRGPQPLDLTGPAFWLTHSYPSAGTYWVTMTVRDDDGGQGASQFMVTVEAPVYGLYLPCVQR